MLLNHHLALENEPVLHRFFFKFSLIHFVLTPSNKRLSCYRQPLGFKDYVFLVLYYFDHLEFIALHYLDHIHTLYESAAKPDRFTDCASLLIHQSSGHIKYPYVSCRTGVAAVNRKLEVRLAWIRYYLCIEGYIKCFFLAYHRIITRHIAKSSRYCSAIH